MTEFTKWPVNDLVYVQQSVYDKIAASICVLCCLRSDWKLTKKTTTTTIVLRPFVQDYLGEPVPEETFTHPPSWSSSNLYQLLPATTIHSILPVQITFLAIFLHNLSPRPFWSGLTLGLEPSTSYSIHFFTQSASSFRNTWPFHRILLCCSIKIISKQKRTRTKTAKRNKSVKQS